MNEPGFSKSDLDVLEFPEVEIDNSEFKMFITRFCRQNAQLSHWSDNVSGLMWACTLSFAANPCDQVSRPFFLSWLLATGYPELCGNQTSANSGVFRNNFCGSFFTPISFLSCLRDVFLDLHFIWECPVLFFNQFRASPHKILLWELSVSFFFHTSFFGTVFFVGFVVLFWSHF